MPENNLEITLSLDDQLTTGLNKARGDLKQFSNDIKAVGRDVGQVGQTLSFFGAGILAPFALALRNVSKTNDDVIKSFNQINSVTNQFSNSIAQSLIPLLQTATGALSQMLTWWNGLNQSTRDFIVQTAVIVGVLGTMGGLFGIMVGKILQTVSAVVDLSIAFGAFAVANAPLVITIGLVTALVVLMVKFKGVADVVISTFEVLFRFLMNGFHTVNATIGGLVEATLRGLLFITEGLARIPGPTQEAFRTMSESIRQTADTAHSFANLELQEVMTNTQKIGDIFRTGEGEWSQAFDSGKQKVQEFINSLGNLQQVGQKTAVVVQKSFSDKFEAAKGALGTLGSALQGAAAQNKKFAVASQAVSIGLAIMNTAQGMTKALADWGFPLGPVFAGIIGAAGAIQIATIAAQSFAVGTPNVPSDMTAQIHKGETIIPATFADAIRKGELSLSGGGSSGGGVIGDIIINLYGITINSKENIRELAEELGFEIDRKFNNARTAI